MLTMADVCTAENTKAAGTCADSRRKLPGPDSGKRCSNLYATTQSTAMTSVLDSSQHSGCQAAIGMPALRRPMMLLTPSQRPSAIQPASHRLQKRRRAYATDAFIVVGQSAMSGSKNDQRISGN